MNRKDLQALTLVGPTMSIPVLDPLSAQHNRQQIKVNDNFHTTLGTTTSLTIKRVTTAT